ncbi:MAG TPA: CHAT domain-containing protein, partial [Chthoniobacterales bacterium]
MEGNAYLDFDVRFTGEAGRYRAEIVNAPAGKGQHTFELPFQEHELENYLLKIGQRRTGMRKADSPENRAAREFGNRLFDAVFQGELQTAFRESLDLARAGDNGLRIRLRLRDTPELADLPWEYLYQSERREFLALSKETPVVRYLDLADKVKPLTVTPPLRVLVMLSSPSDLDCLDVEKEWQKLKEAVRHLEEQKRLIVERLERATLSELQSRLRKGSYHIFHFVGHGSFDPVTEESVLAFEDENGRKRLVSGPDLGIYLRDEPDLRLVLLNACEGARASRSDPFSGAAQSLVQKGIPAVIAMQFEVSDEAAIAMADGFYSALSDDYPVDAALAEARKAVFAAGCSVEWGTPVLYLRAPDGRIFDVNKAAAPAAQDQSAKEPERKVVEPPPLPKVVTPPPKTPEVAQKSERRGSRPWIWMLLGMFLTFAALVSFGVYLKSKEQ